MANDTVVSVRGWAGCDPTIYKNENPDSGEDLQISSTVFTLGVTPRTYNKRSHTYENGATTWYSIRCYGALAVNVGKSVHRGAPLLVRGRLVTRSFTDKQGVSRSVQQIVADSVAIDLNFMVATYEKVASGTSFGSTGHEPELSSLRRTNTHVGAESLSADNASVYEEITDFPREEVGVGV